MNKKGMTLVELLVYMVLAAFLLTPVIMLVHKSSLNMARDAGSVNLQMSGRELLNIMYNDLRNTGYKLYSSGVAVPEVSYAGEDESDSSSFMPGNKKADNGVDNDYYDTLTVRMGKLDADGGWAGIDDITYKVENRELKRIKGGDKATLAKNVAALKFQYSDNLTTWYDKFDASPDPDDPKTGDMKKKGVVEYIKVVLVLKDDKRLAPVNNQTITVINGITINNTGNALYERHEIVIPVPNNGLFPEGA